MLLIITVIVTLEWSLSAQRVSWMSCHGSRISMNNLHRVYLLWANQTLKYWNN
jgi:hypothetical protein